MAIITAVADGLASELATWGYVSIPTIGDTVVIGTGITVTVAEAMTVGTDGVSGTAAVTVQGTGKLNISSTLEVRGDIVQQRGSTVDVQAGGSVTFNAPDAATRYVWKVAVGGTTGFSTLKTTGTGWGTGEFATITSDVSRGGLTAWIDSYTGLYSILDFAYAKLVGLGAATQKSLRWYGFGTSSIKMRNVLMQDVGLFECSVTANSPVDIDRLDIRNPLDTAAKQYLNFTASVAKNTTRSLSNLSVYCPGSTKIGQIGMDFLVSDVYLYNAKLNLYSAAKNTIVDKTVMICDDVTDNNLIVTYPLSNQQVREAALLFRASNPHFIVETNAPAGNGLTGIKVDSVIFDADGYYSGDAGEGLITPFDGQIWRSLMIGGSGTMYGNVLGPVGSCSLYHCTAYGPKTNLASPGETTPGGTQQLVEFKSNLCVGNGGDYETTESGIKQRIKFESQTGFTTDYNCTWDAWSGDLNGTPLKVTQYPAGHPYAGQYSYLGAARYNPWWSDPAEVFGVTQGVHDLVEDPQFFDATRNVRTWVGSILNSDVSGYTSAQLGQVIVQRNGLDYQGDPVTPPASLSATECVTWIKEGFAPGNRMLKATGHDGYDIGAVPWRDTTAPTVNGFTITLSSQVLYTVNVDAIPVSDDVGITGYHFEVFAAGTTIPANPDPDTAALWDYPAPSTLTMPGDGTYYVAVWVKDAAGNVSVPTLANNGTPILVDSVRPVMTAFTVPATVVSSTVPVTTLDATDENGVYKWLIRSDDTTPTIATAGWTASKPTSVTVAASGLYTLHAYAMDAAGNISLPAVADVVIDIPSIDTTNFTSTMIAEDVLSRVRQLANDSLYAEWPLADLLNYINDAQREIINLHPQANVVSTLLPLAAGARQVLPDPMVMLHKVVCNVDATGAPGDAPAMMSEKVMNTLLPQMYGQASSQTVLACGYDAQDPKTLYVYPPHTAGTGRKLLVVAVNGPAEATEITSLLTVGKEYLPAITDYVLYRAHQYETGAGSAELAAKFLADYSAKVQIVPPRG